MSQMHSVLREVRRIAHCGRETSELKQEPTTPIVPPEPPSKTAREAVNQLRTLTEEAEMSRRPPNPADLIDALQDSIHYEVGESRAAKSVRSQQK